MTEEPELTKLTVILGPKRTHQPVWPWVLVAGVGLPVGTLMLARIWHGGLWGIPAAIVMFILGFAYGVHLVRRLR